MPKQASKTQPTPAKELYRRAQILRQVDNARDCMDSIDWLIREALEGQSGQTVDCCLELLRYIREDYADKLLEEISQWK